ARRRGAGGLRALVAAARAARAERARGRVGQPGARRGRMSAGGTDYATYLLVDDLLTLQRPLTPEAHDELLFIVVHQSYELWFKVILHELRAARAALAGGRPQAAIPRLQRVTAVERLLLEHLSVLETMGPEGFLE